MRIFDPTNESANCWSALPSYNFIIRVKQPQQIKSSLIGWVENNDLVHSFIKFLGTAMLLYRIRHKIISKLPLLSCSLHDKANYFYCLQSLSVHDDTTSQHLYIVKAEKLPKNLLKYILSRFTLNILANIE